MFKFLGFGRGARSSDHLKDKQGKDLFEFTKAIEHGFPPKSSAIAHDPALSLLAIGTSTGLLKIYGRPGVELSARHAKETVIQELHFLPEQGRVISVCDDGEQNTIHLWEVNKRNGKSVLEEVKTCTLEGRLKKISVCRLSMSTNRLYLGTEGGNIYLLDINSFELQEYVIYQDVVMQSVSDENKSNAGSVEAIQEHPSDSNKILIGYRKGLTVLWEHDTCNVRQTFLVSQELQGVAWYPEGDKFVSAHADGSLNVWSIGEDEMNRDSNTPFGPFPCKAITKVELSNNLLFFAGGMPRASYGDKHCISVMKDSTIQVVFDFTSHVLDFFTIGEEDSHFLVVLCEQEFVLVDLSGKDKGYPTFVKPYLACLHSSPITSSHHCHNCPSELWDKIIAAGREHMTDEHSSKDWPITGGKAVGEQSDTRNLLITGHEDGSVNFWDVSHDGMSLLYAVQTSKLFVGDHEAADNEPQEGEEDAWPPFKKVGNFDPCSDDPRYAVTKVTLCTKTSVLTVGGNGGQVLIFDICDESSEVELEMIEVDFIADKENFQWKGHGPLLPKEGQIATPRGFKPRMGLQLTPAAPITALAAHSAWGLVAAGTVHGVIVFDYLNKKTVTSKWTVVEGESATGEHLSRKKSLKQSIRNSFRRLRSRKGTSPKKRGEGGEGEEHAAAQATSPVSRLVNENRVEEDVMSMVRCLYFVDTYLRDAANRSASLWAGTNSGHIYVFFLTVPEDRSAGEVTGELGKEIKLKHKAPVVSIFVVDKDGVPLGPACADDGGKGPDMSGQHSLVICSEEQFKTFTLPHLKPRTKEKLTAIDGSRVRKIGLINITSKNDEPGVVYHCLASLSNQGELSVYSIPRLKLQVKASCLRKEDVSGISSLVFTSDGQGFYLSSNSEMQRFSLTANQPLERDCILELAEGMRPAEPEPEVAAVVEAEVEAEKKSRSSSSSSSSSEPKKDEEEEKKEGEEEKKEEEEKEAEKEKGDEESDKHEDTLEISEVTTIIKTEPLEESETRTQMVSQTRTVVSESHSYTKQTSGTEEMPDLSELSLDAKTTEMSSFSVQSSSHVVSQKTVVSSSSTTERVITSEGVTIENGDMEKFLALADEATTNADATENGEEEPEVHDSGEGKKRGKGFKSPGKLFSRKDADDPATIQA